MPKKMMYTVSYFDRENGALKPFDRVERTMEEARRAAVSHHKEILRSKDLDPEGSELQKISGSDNYESTFDSDWEWYIQPVEALETGSVYTVTFWDRYEKDVNPFGQAYGTWEEADAAVRGHVVDMTENEDALDDLEMDVGRDKTRRTYKVPDYNSGWRWTVKEAEYR